MLDSDEISTATPIFSESINPNELLGILSDVTGSRKSKMAVAKREVLISQLID